MGGWLLPTAAEPAVIVSSYHFAFGPLVALGALAVIVLICVIR